MANDETGELLLERRLDHESGETQAFYRSLQGPCRVPQVPAVAPGDFDVTGSILLRFINTTLSQITRIVSSVRPSRRTESAPMLLIGAPLR